MKTQITAGFASVILACAFLLTGCESDNANVSVRRIVVDGDNAKYVGHLLNENLLSRGVRISETAEQSPVLKGTSILKKLASGVEVFTLEITDGSGLNIKATLSTQDIDVFSRNGLIPLAVRQAANALVEKLEPKQAAPPPATSKPEHYTSS